MDYWNQAPGPSPPRGPPTTTPQLGAPLGQSFQGGYHPVPAGETFPPQTYVQMAAGNAAGIPQTMYNPQPPAQVTVPSLTSQDAFAAPQTTYNGLGLESQMAGPTPRTRDVQGSGVGSHGSPLECILRPSATGSPVCKLRAFGIACFILGLLTGAILGHFFDWLWWLLGVILLLGALFLVYWFCFHSRAGRASRGLGRMDKGDQEGMAGGRDESESDDCC